MSDSDRAKILVVDDPALDALLAPAISFHDLPARLPDILEPTCGVLCQVIRYA